MSDTRFIMLGLILVFAGFMFGGIVGSQYVKFTVQANEFGDCFDYTSEGKAIPVSCTLVIQNKYVVLAVVVALVAGGIASLVKGAKGKWDQDVRSDEMVGPKRGSEKP